jgi:hypothetical protein
VTTPDFQSYSLAMFCGEKMVFSSGEPGLKPLADCLEIYRGRYQGCLLHDKVVGLAAAKLILYSGLVSEVVTGISSAPAKSFLFDNGVSITASLLVDNIMTRDRTAICPGERIALGTDDRDEFLIRIYQMVKAK